VAEIENEDISVDELAEKVKRASELIRICKDVLYKTEAEVNSILKEMQDENTPTE
jgi:exodeoxyribonuclease VII small subunit